MNRLFASTLAAIASYIGVWTLAYGLIYGTDFSYYFEYLRLTWSNRAGEIPTFLHGVSVCAAIGGGLVTYLKMKNKDD
mgnify:CR=1 FL=1